MKKLHTTLAATGLMLMSPTAFSAVGVAVGHFAPFADSVDGTAVNIAVNGAVALEDVKFKGIHGIPGIRCRHLHD